MRRIGVLMNTGADEPESQARLAAFMQGLQELGWAAGGNLRIDYRWSPGDLARLRKDAAELVALRPEVILAGVGATTSTLQQVTRTIPIVMAQSIDPVGNGFVDSRAARWQHDRLYSVRIQLSWEVVGAAQRGCAGFRPHNSRDIARGRRRGDRMNRREFIGLLAGAAATWPLAARAQQPEKLPTIGFLGAGTLSAWSHWVAAFVQRLRERGWIEGRTFAIEYRFAEGRPDRFAEIAAEFVRLKVDVIVTSGTEATLAAKQATSVIPIVFATAGDPVGIGLVASLARPGGNVTGLSLQQTDTAGKRLELLSEVVPALRRLAILANIGNPINVLEMGDTQAAARTLGFEVAKLEIRRAEDIAPAFEALKGRADALYVCGDALVNTNRIRINTLAVGARLPTMHGFREHVEAGGLMSYGQNYPDLFRRAAD